MDELVLEIIALRSVVLRYLCLFWRVFARIFLSRSRILTADSMSLRVKVSSRRSCTLNSWNASANVFWSLKYCLKSSSVTCSCSAWFGSRRIEFLAFSFFAAFRKFLKMTSVVCPISLSKADTLFFFEGKNPKPELLLRRDRNLALIAIFCCRSAN